LVRSQSDDYVRFLDRTSTQPGQRHPALSLLELGPDRCCLDLGCGLGEDSRAISDAFGAEVVGIDHSRRMVDEARARSVGHPRVSFVEAEAACLPFPDSAFDAAWVKRTLMHIAEPSVVFGELARVVRPGGCIVAVEPDLECVLLDSGLVDTTRKLLDLHAAVYANPRAGRQLHRLLREAGLSDVRVAVEPMEIAHLATAQVIFRLAALTETGIAQGILTLASI
jgi:ubiquinone/menaquinone biosynthesis C-methylase UbiE